MALPVLYSDIELSKPEIIKQGNRYGVRLKAVAPSVPHDQVDVEAASNRLSALNNKVKS